MKESSIIKIGNDLVKVTFKEKKAILGGGEMHNLDDPFTISSEEYKREIESIEKVK